MMRASVCRACLVLIACAASRGGQASAAGEGVRAWVEAARAPYGRTGGALAIRDIVLPARVRAYARAEITFELTASYDNPFDPDDIDVTGTFTTPSGKRVVVPAFYAIPFVPRDGRTKMQAGLDYRRDGEARWILRYSSGETGRHRVTITALERMGAETEASVGAFEISPSDLPGYVRVARGNPQYFENSADGSLFYPVGVNIPWTRDNERQITGHDPSFEYYYGKARGAMSATRLWACHWAWLEWSPPDARARPGGYAGAGYYNQRICASIDRIFALAEEQDLRIMLVTEDNNEHFHDKSYGGWDANPYNTANGGPCASTRDVFSHPEARRLYRARLRYIIARWGYSHCLWAINSWNDCSAPGSATLSWLEEMRDYVHGLARGYRPVVYGSNFRHQAQDLMDYAQGESARRVPGKPNVVQEVHYSRSMEWFAHSMHRTMWRGLADGLAGSMIWPHATVDKLGAWRPTFAAIDTFLVDVPLNLHRSSPADVVVERARVAGSPELVRVASVESYGDVKTWGQKATNDRFVIDTSKGSQWLTGFSPTLYGRRPGRGAWRTEPEFTVDLPRGGAMMVRVGEVSGPTELGSSVDGDVRVPAVFSGSGRRAPKRSEEWVRIELPAGRSTVRLWAEGRDSDWLRLNKICVLAIASSPAEMLRVSGVVAGDCAVLYVTNETAGELYGDLVGARATEFTHVSLRVGTLSRGAYRVELFDTRTGRCARKWTARSARGTVGVTIPAVADDVAVKIRRAR